MYYCCGLTETGRPDHNEDALLLHSAVLTAGEKQIACEAPFVCAVSDGVSGENAGEVASKTCAARLSGAKFAKRSEIRRKILEIHAEVLAAGRKNPELSRMQATLCGFAVDESHALFGFNVGDSRLYRLRGGVLEQLSKDQTLVQMLYDEGSISSEEKKHHSFRHVVMPVMGNPDSPPRPDVFTVPGGLQFGELLLLCTDGLSDSISDYEMAEVLSAPKPLPERLHMMAMRALRHGARDNITACAAVRYPDGIPLPPCEWM